MILPIGQTCVYSSVIIYGMQPRYRVISDSLSKAIVAVLLIGLPKKRLSTIDPKSLGSRSYL
jgi:hypothetical protein